MYFDFLLNFMSEDLFYYFLIILLFLLNFRFDDKNNNIDFDGFYGILVIMLL